VKVIGAPTPVWDAAVDAYLGRLRADNCTPATIETYRTLLIGGRSVAFRKRHEVTNPGQLVPVVLESLKREFLCDGLRPSTVDDYCRVWRSFSSYCIDRGWLTSVDILRVKGPRQPQVRPPVFTAEEERLLLSACRCRRDRVLVRIVIETGLRRSEIANLTVDDLIDAGQAWVVRVRQGKGRKDRGVPISDAFAAELEQYLSKVRPRAVCRSLFLTSTRCVAGDFGPLSSTGIYMIWRRLGQATGIRAYPHKARHTFATRLAQDGVVPWAIQRALGHSTIAMTERYVDAASIDLLDAFARRTPRQRTGLRL
jgi:integrase